MGRTLAQRALRTSATVMTVALVLLAIGTAVGRWRVLPVGDVGGESAVARGSAVMLQPTPTVSLHKGDTIYFTIVGQKGGTFRRVDEVVDSWARQVQLDGPDGPGKVIELPEQSWRVSHQIPYAGLPFSLLAGPVQAAMLVLNGVLLVGFGERRRRPPPPPDEPSQSRRRLHVPKPRIAAAAAISMVLAGALSALALPL